MGQALERGGRFEYPERVVRPDGSIRELATVGEGAVDGNGRVVGLIGTCRDVTAERRRDETIRLYADIVHHMQIGLAVWDVGDPGDIDTVRLVTHNPASEAVARRPLAGRLGQPLPQHLPLRRRIAHRESSSSTSLATAASTETVVDRAQNPAHPNRAVAAKSLRGSRAGAWASRWRT